MKFYTGLHQPSDAQHFERCMVSVNRLRDRKSNFAVGEWIMDSGAFSTVLLHGGYPEVPEVYAGLVRRWAKCGQMAAAVSQDYMCEPWMLQRTGRSISEHQHLTVFRYLAIRESVGDAAYVMPVLQGYAADDYVRHLEIYGDRLIQRAWVGVGSVCKRNGSVDEVEVVLGAIKAARPDLRLHGFGLKTSALYSGFVRECLYSADSMAWSYHARKHGRDSNDWREAAAFAHRIEVMPVQHTIWEGAHDER